MSAQEVDISLEEFRTQARQWLAENAEPLQPDGDDTAWGKGSDDVSVFHDLSPEEERGVIEALCAWQRRKMDAGFGAIIWPPEYGGRGLPEAYAHAFAEEEAAFRLPPMHELFPTTVELIAPTVRLFGTPEQQKRIIPSLLRGEELACQLFSEPGAGSDLAALGTRAVRDGDDWVVTGQKVWTSGAQFAQWGELIARTDPDVPKHRGLTAFLLPLDTPGVDIRPLRQMSGGSSFNEVYLDAVRIPDRLRLGDVGAGWSVTLATLGFERGADSRPAGIGASWPQLLALASWLGRTDDPLVRQKLARVYVHHRTAQLLAVRDRDARRAGGPPGPEGSLRKLQWVAGLRLIGEVAADLLGPRITADTGEWGTFAWSSHLLGAPGYRIAGGSEEIQRTIIAERVLKMPAEPRLDRDVPWRELPR